MPMERLIGLATLGVALCTAAAYGQQGNRTETNGEVARYITDMERRWLQANITHEPSILEKILADDFQMMHEDGRFSTKSEEIAFIKSNKCKVESDHLDDSKVRIFGDVAVDYGWETFTIKCGNKVKTGTYFWGGTWLQRGGRWQLVAAMLPPPAAISPLLRTKK